MAIPSLTMDFLKQYFGDFTSTAESEKELTRSDFRRVDLKGSGKKYYFSFEDRALGIELCLEPCASGFDTALYKNSMDSPLYSQLVGKKICTNFKSGIYKDEKDNVDKLMMQDFLQGTLERSQKVWDKALNIANRLYRIERNNDKLKRWKMIEKIGQPDPNDLPPYSPQVPPIVPPAAPYDSYAGTIYANPNSKLTSKDSSMIKKWKSLMESVIDKQKVEKIPKPKSKKHD